MAKLKSPTNHVSPSKKKMKHMESVMQNNINNIDQGDSEIGVKSSHTNAEFKLSHHSKHIKKKKQKSKLVNGTGSTVIENGEDNKLHSHVRLYYPNKKRMVLTDSYVCNLFKTIPFPKKQESDMDNESDNEEDEKVVVKRASTHEELRERLRLKLETFRGKRLDFQDRKERKKMLRRAAKLDQKKKRVQQKKTKKNFKNSIENELSNTPVPINKPVFYSDNKMVFSKFDFKSHEVVAKKNSKKNKTPRQMLEKIQKEEEQIKEMKDPSQIEVIKESKGWQSALQRSEGMKVKDNPQLLKKTIKKHEQRKKKSTKEWEKRLESANKKMSEKQNRRQENIQQKKQDKKKKKEKHLRKKGRIV